MLRVADQHRSDKRPPLRILQVVGELNRGGIETWLLHALREIDRDRFAMDFVVETAEPGDYNEEVLELGSPIFCAGSRRLLQYGSRLCRIIREHGPYDIVHGHLNHYNGLIMRLARQAGVPTRISHSHTDTTAKERSAGLVRRLGVRLMRRWIVRHSTLGLAASVPAAISMFGDQWQQRGICRVMHCGVDLNPFSQQYDRTTTRRELQIPQDAWVIGQVGRMVEAKNHRLIIDTFAEILPHSDNAYLLLVGDGPLHGEIENRAREVGVIDRVRFAGTRNDVPRILCAAVDAFVFPSKFEGLGIALLEAQAAGLPCVVSDVVPEEADVVPGLITRLSMSEPWAPTLLRTRTSPRRQKQALDRLLRTDFSIQQSVIALQRAYEEAAASAPHPRRVPRSEAIK